MRRLGAVVWAAGALLDVLAGCGGGGGSASPAPVDASFAIATGVREPAGVGVASGAGRWLVAWGALGEAGLPAVLGLRLDGDGASTDAAPLVLSDLGGEPFLAPASAFYGLPSVAFDGATFGTFFFGRGPLVGQDASVPDPAGQVVGFTPVPSEGGEPPRATAILEQATFGQARTSLVPPVVAAAAAGRFLEVHARDLLLVGSFGTADVAGSFVAVGTGGIEVQYTTVVDPGDLAGSGALRASGAGVAFGAGRPLAVYVETYRAGETAADGEAARLQGSWVAPNAPPVRVTLTGTTLGAEPPAVASDGGRFLIVWIAPATDGATSPTELRGLHFTPDASGGGTVDPPGGFVIAGGDADKTLGGVAFGGGTYLVTWLEDDVVLGTRVAPGASPGAAFTVDAGPAESAAVASDGQRFLVAAVRMQSGEVRGTFVPASE